MPGSLTPRFANEVVVSLSNSFFRYAAEPTPRSAVWRNQAGSLLAREAAISFLDISSGGFCVLVARFVNVSGIDATDCGRALMEPAPLDVGR